MGHLDRYNLLSDKQHAFRKWHSCETQLITVINDWAKILDKKGQVDTFIFDFEKAFDTPPHELLKSSMPIHVLQYVIHVQKLLCTHKIPTAYEQKCIQRNDACRN